MNRYPSIRSSAHRSAVRRQQRLRPFLELEPLEDRRLLSTDVLTYHNDLTRDGDNLTETTLTPSNVNRNSFGLLFSYPVDGQVYAQPLYMANVTLPDHSVHNMVFVVTENDSAYAFDANNPTAGPNGNGILWQDSFIDPGNGITPISAADVNCGAINPQIGITDTPVIDPNTGILYFVAATEITAGDGTVSFHQQLHALDIRTGQEALGGPVEIQAAVPGDGDGGHTETFDPEAQLERDGLVLANGVVYTTWASHCDIVPAHGWVIGYDAQTLQQVAVFSTSPNAQLSTLWSGAPAVDSNGNLFFVTGNGEMLHSDDSNLSLGDYPDAVLKLSPATGQLSVADFFMPFNEHELDVIDEDLGSGAAMLLPDQPGPIPHLLVVAGKEGTIYLINRDNMGQFDPNQDNVVQELPSAIGGQGEYGSPAYFDTGTPDGHYIYFGGWGDSLRAFQLFDNGTLSTDSTSQSSNSFDAWHGATPSLSANGTADGIVWAIDANDGNAVLYAYDATNLAHELYDSNQAGTRDQLDGGLQFSVPTIADGQVFVGTADTLSIFGLLPGGGGAAARKSRLVVPVNSGIDSLLMSLAAPEAPGAVAGQGKAVVPSLSASDSRMALLPVFTERFARDSVFGMTQSTRHGLASEGPLPAQDLDLLVMISLGANAVFPCK
jgi:hypothetical protein